VRFTAFTVRITGRLQSGCQPLPVSAALTYRVRGGAEDRTASSAACAYYAILIVSRSRGGYYFHMEKNRYKISFQKAIDGTVIGGRIWIDKKGKNFLGLGKIIFLEKIREYGSISKAAESLGMSYRKAWGLAEGLNALAEKPLVNKKAGGAGGGGAELTEEGERVLALYWDVCRRFEEFLELQEDILKGF
jgi:molybdate transport system regulatory protein